MTQNIKIFPLERYALNYKQISNGCKAYFSYKFALDTTHETVIHSQNIIWFTPVGGGGPKYGNM